MEPLAANYKPSLRSAGKYFVYVDYLREYLYCRDYRSLSASFRYLLTHRLPQKNYIARSRMGTFEVRKGTTDFQFINYAYERKVRKYITRHLNSFDVFIDAGACIGEYCIWLAKMGKRCIAVEPVNFEAVRTNVRLNGVEDRVQVFPCGLGRKQERVFFSIPTGLPSSSYANRESGEEPNVCIETLDSLVSKFQINPGDRVLMKLDVEGMEEEVIEGARQFIQKQEHLSLIYEHFSLDDYRNDKALLKLAPFTFDDIDPVNRVAVKQKSRPSKTAH